MFAASSTHLNQLKSASFVVDGYTDHNFIQNFVGKHAKVTDAQGKTHYGFLNEVGYDKQAKRFFLIMDKPYNGSDVIHIPKGKKLKIVLIGNRTDAGLSCATRERLEKLAKTNILEFQVLARSNKVDIVNKFRPFLGHEIEIVGNSGKNASVERGYLNSLDDISFKESIGELYIDLLRPQYSPDDMNTRLWINRVCSSDYYPWGFKVRLAQD